MCRPEFFTVSYRINPWMHPEPADGHRSRRVSMDGPVRDVPTFGDRRRVGVLSPACPTWSTRPTAGSVLDGVALGPRFRYHNRAGEAPAYMQWFADAGLAVVEPTSFNEGEGDYLLVGDTIFAGSGFRSDRQPVRQLHRVYGRDVVSLKLVDPRFYHLDTAFAVLDSAGGPQSVAYLPDAFDRTSRRTLARRFPDAITVSEQDALVLGLNCFSDGRNVVVASQATGFARDLAAAGYRPHPVDMSELLLGGGGVKCCTLSVAPGASCRYTFAARYRGSQSIGFAPCDSKAALALLKGRDPKKPLAADMGEGCALAM